MYITITLKAANQTAKD